VQFTAKSSIITAESRNEKYSFKYNVAAGQIVSNYQQALSMTGFYLHVIY